MKFKSVFCLLALAFLLSNAAAAQVQLVLNTTGNTTINRHIYGHFSEHLGRCIYDGFWVSDSLNVPKKDRIRLDVVDALKKIQIPNLRWPVVALQMNIIGAMALVHAIKGLKW